MLHRILTIEIARVTEAAAIVAATLRGLYGADVSGTLQLRPVWWLSGLAIALGGIGTRSRRFQRLQRL